LLNEGPFRNLYVKTQNPGETKNLVHWLLVQLWQHRPHRTKCGIGGQFTRHFEVFLDLSSLPYNRRHYHLWSGDAVEKEGWDIQKESSDPVDGYPFVVLQDSVSVFHFLSVLIRQIVRLLSFFFRSFSTI
jgi:hypothetical protein